jgi:ectoine hydroxylase-related dioxygenase (phytanoyl-CoA dioxygenase family)
MIVSPALQNQFHEEGYCVLEHVIPSEHLAALDHACRFQLEKQAEWMDKVKADVLGLTHKDKRYFLSCQHEPGSPMQRFLFSGLMAGIVRPLLGGDAFLFLEIFVVKARRTGMSFGWHQDSGYMLGRPHPPYVTLWCALDDVTEHNGALHVLPYARAGTREVVPHAKERQTGDLVGYTGDDPGVIVPVPRGSIVALSSTVFHRSGPNTTEAPRRAFLAAYSLAPIFDEKGNLWNQAVPFLQGGARVPQDSPAEPVEG